MLSKSCGHEMTDILDTSENVDGSGVTLVSRLETCVMCGQRRTVTETNGQVSESPWEPFRIRVSADHAWGPSQWAGTIE